MSASLSRLWSLCDAAELDTDAAFAAAGRLDAEAGYRFGLGDAAGVVASYAGLVLAVEGGRAGRWARPCR